MNAKSKPLPLLRSDAQAEKFVASADLSKFDLSGFKPMKFDIDAHSKAPLTQTPAAPSREKTDNAGPCNER
jgi:hypothetical protein